MISYPNLFPLLLALAQTKRHDSILEDLYGLKDLFILLAAFALIAIMVWLARRTGTITGFVIHVTDEGVHFTGKFPHALQLTVINFLRNDLAVEGPYEIRGRWDDQLLIIVVKGAAEPQEQRIRNFLKLTLKKSQ